MPFVVKYLDQNNHSNNALEKIDMHSINDSEHFPETYEFQRYEKIDSLRFYFNFYNLKFRNENDPNASFISQKITGIWGKFDNQILKPIFIDDWPNVKEDHNQISNKIIDVFNEYQIKKIKSKEMAIVSSSDINDKTKDNVITLLDENQVKQRKSIEKN